MSEIDKFCRVTVATPIVDIGNVKANYERHKQIIKDNPDSDFIIFPELSLTGYTCEDLFHQKVLQEAVLNSLHEIAESSRSKGTTLLIGAPLMVEGRLRNCAVVILNGDIIGVVPKTYLPNYREFYECRWFVPGHPNDPKEVVLFPDKSKSCPFGTDLIFVHKTTNTEYTFGVEVCEDLWAPIPPSTFQALNGATLLFNLSASNEVIGKADYRRRMINSQSAKLCAAYIYCSSGPTESTKDLVFGGHNIVSECGSILFESKRFIRETHTFTCDIDNEKILSERALVPNTFGTCAHLNDKALRKITKSLYSASVKKTGFYRTVDAYPFVPKNKQTLHKRCWEIFNTQTCALAKRLENVSKDIYIGVSGGLDSTLALLVACKTYDMLEIERKHIHGMSMLGFGTSDRTRNNAMALMKGLGVSSKEIDIRDLCISSWNKTGYYPFAEHVQGDNKTPLTLARLLSYLPQVPSDAVDLKFENTQARIRTNLLMNEGFTLGTGDLSEIALGWSTYNGDHMNMYNVNCDIPKTLVKFLVNYIAQNDPMVDLETKACLEDILNTPISPELMPNVQETEKSVGPYELQDFFLYNFVRFGFSPKKILFLAKSSDFVKKYEETEIKKWLKLFLERFFSQQYKRDCMPAGPKVGTISLSPRGDWRMPSEADVALWLENL